MRQKTQHNRNVVYETEDTTGAAAGTATAAAGSAGARKRKQPCVVIASVAATHNDKRVQKRQRVRCRGTTGGWDRELNYHCEEGEEGREGRKGLRGKEDERPRTILGDIITPHPYCTAQAIHNTTCSMNQSILSPESAHAHKYCRYTIPSHSTCSPWHLQLQMQMH